MIRLVVVLVVFILAMLLGHCHAQAQTPITSENIITPTVGAWTGSVAGQNGGFSGGGNGPAFNSTTNTLIFGYTPATTTQRISAEAFAIQHALDLSNSGIKINGYNYSWQINNSGEQTGTLTGKVEMLRSGNALQSYTYNYDAPTNGFELKTGTQTFNNPQDLLAADQITLSFTGKDNRFWAGYYGPQVRNPSLTLNYTTDPCMGNPLYSPSCPNYNQVLTSQTIFAQQYAINQALNLSGAGVNINGFEYGYHYYVGGDWCSATFLGIFCTQTSSSSMAVDVNVTSNTGSSLYSATHNHTQQNTGGQPSYSYVFPQQRLLSTMGNFSLTTREVGSTALYSSWSRWQYTPDPCTIDPLSSQSCPGYAAAYQVQQCTSNPLYNSACPGYAQAMFVQQCSANALSDPSCPGYASAYLTYQCTINPLYSTTCSGYETAYLDQQCSINPLYSTRCSGYAAAYKTQQCTANPLYDSTCDGYSTAYKNQQCSLNALYATDCPGYAAAYKTQQCTANPLYATDCAGYEQAYLNAQCIKDSLYSNKCEGYATAYAIKNLITFSDSTVSSSVNGALSDTAATKANDPATTKVAVNTVTTSINTDGSVSTGVSATGDTNVDKAITAKASTTNTSPAAAVQLAPPPPAPQQQMAQNEPKGGGDKPEPKGGNKQEDKKDDAPKGSGGNSPSQNTNNAQASSDKPAAPTARQAIQERREAAAKAEAVEKGKNLANEMGKASDLEAQKAVQNVVIQAMGFTPGFDAYSKQIIVQQQFYKPYQVYGNQKNIDSRANLRMFGGTDSLHQQMIESQYNKGN
jgi:hypothetical protein